MLDSFFFSSRRRHTRFDCDWSSDVCSSDLRKAEDRELFKRAIEGIGLTLPRSGYARTIDDAKSIVRTTGYPAIIRPSFTLGGTGGSIAYKPEELEEAVRWGVQPSPAGNRVIPAERRRIGGIKVSVRV